MSSPHFPTGQRPIGTLPTITVEFPREIRLALLAAMAAKMGYRIRWIRRAKAAEQ